MSVDPNAAINAELVQAKVLEAFRQTGALLDGHFLLRSGLHSRQFFQCAHLLQHAELASDLCGDLAAKVKALDLAFDAVVSPAMGGILVGQDVARHLRTRHIFAEKAEGKLVIRRFAITPGQRFLVAEDVVTTGSAVRETIARVTEAGGVIAGICCIVERGEKVDFGVPFVSLLRLQVETFAADAIPEDLRGVPAVKPGSGK
ncbi:orotate phosphoribosyltransferase [Verrucomicrobium sp. GAS474]|uniref:orotate phosphoribosyltransferase n=1 Tax=Verrucomicrobium sp. GAS474 TaxID=1882831 RepID=UPI00087951A4|nr:orotate phosphoribosyltransferase [Verrucomicrobium sp. GAS474]SDU08312.1 orotate phosphoribosyltransferase [Verrucomicrobium sp. GAS474]